jgi:1,4-dihydroxy-2-naphthoate octaprenyltransferase
LAAVNAWLLAARPRTLVAGLVPIAVGTAIASSQGVSRPGVAALAALTALLLQITANLANDVFDFERGADDAGRLGPARAVATGLLAPAAVRRATYVCAAASAVAGLGLVWIGGWPIALAGAASLVAAIAYTGGPWPLGYHGLGDLCTFLFFGVVGVAGSYYVQAGELSGLALAASIPVGCLVTAILVVNNVRDLESDARVGKRTLAVRMGRRGTRIYYAVLLGTAYLGALALGFAVGVPRAALFPLASVLLAFPLLRTVMTRTDGPALNAALAGTARLTLVFGVLIALGFIA